VSAALLAHCSSSPSQGGGADAGTDVHFEPGADGGHTAPDAGKGTIGSDASSAKDTGTGGGTGTPFAVGTICNSSGTKLTPPATVKHVIVIMEENENFGSVNGNAMAPYISSLATDCGYASNYADNTFAENLVSNPHYLALTSGSNCNTGVDESGTGCITTDGDASGQTLSTTSIFAQVSSWKAYEESMTGNCATSSSGSYATKHNPPAYYSTLSTCSADDVPIAALTCDSSSTMTPCGTPTGAFAEDLANDTLAALSFVTPNLDNDMHNGTVTQGDNWLYTYMPLILTSKSYLAGEVVVLVLWDEQATVDFGGAVPNLFVSPYITAGTVVSTQLNHFATLRAMEKALGISTYLGCASGTILGGGTCAAGSTADLRGAFNF